MNRAETERAFLVVDDEPDILDSIQRLFRKQYTVFTAQTVDEAMELLDTESIQVVMTDQRMPRTSGVHFLANLRERHPDIVRVLLTGYSNIDHVVDAINEGHVYRYISKPWNPAELRLFVAQAFDHYESRRERELLVEELREINEKLEDRNIALSRANEELKMLDRMKTVFMEVVSHELNTPIAVITGYEFLLRRELGDALESPVTQKALHGIGNSARRLKDISSRIFKMLTSEDTRTALKLETFEISTLIDALLTHVEPFLEKRSQRLEIELDPEVSTVRADREKLIDILVNLVMNAIKFSYDDAPIMLTVRLVEHEEHEDEIEFSVQDQGVGVSEEDIEQIFAPFFSTFSSRYHSSGDFEFGKRGIGLGLTVAKRFSEMHGGSITVESRPDEGATFTVRLPRQPKDFDSSSGELSRPGI